MVFKVVIEQSIAEPPALQPQAPEAATGLSPQPQAPEVANPPPPTVINHKDLKLLRVYW